MEISLKIGLNAITSYKRLAYTPWHAIAEFVDNSTQSYFDHKDMIDSITPAGVRPLYVEINYDLDSEYLQIKDNAMGMSFEELENALIIAKKPENDTGRSRYGMGLKTAACWIGNLWKIKTKKLGETTGYEVEVDVDKVANGKNILPFTRIEKLAKEDHFTIIEIYKHNQHFKGRTLRKIQDYLSSMYREDFRNNVLDLSWNGNTLYWEEIDERLLQDKEKRNYKRDFKFYIDDENGQKEITGWVGILKSGSRKDAGFSILHSGRVVKGWPDAWRPSTLYGQIQGSNDLVNQRLVGEINLDAFEISHTKDGILWLGDQEEKVESGLYEQCKDYRDVALKFRKSTEDERRPSLIETQTAINEFQKELESKELIDIIITDPMVTPGLVAQVVKVILINAEEKFTESFRATIGNLTVKGYVEEMSVSDPYVTIDSADPNEVIIILNASHPHWNQLSGASGVLNFLRHCTYDGIAEWQARNKVSTIDPDTIKILKDRLLRLPLEIENHLSN